MSAILSVRGLTKSYASGHTALHGIDLDVREGEIFALLGPNGAGKTTLISIICGIVRASGGSVHVAGHDIARHYRSARGAIGLVPQELHTEQFEKVIHAVRFSRGLFGRPKNEAVVEQVLRDLSLWDKRDAKILELSGGMKRRVMIAKALVHEPQLLFLDEPTAGVDVELRREMWELVRQLRSRGVTIILTTHYIEEAEEMADRVGVIDQGRLIVVEDKSSLMRRMGRKTLTVHLDARLAGLPDSLSGWPLKLSPDGGTLSYEYETHGESGVPKLLGALTAAGIGWKDVDTRQSSLEDIFVGLIHNGASENAGAAA